MANYKLNEAAAEDLQQLIEFGIDRFGLDTAKLYLDGMTKRFENLAEAPLRYQSVDHIYSGYRRSVYGSHSIYYRIGDTNIEIMRILNRQNPDNAFEKNA